MYGIKYDHVFMLQTIICGLFYICITQEGFEEIQLLKEEEEESAASSCSEVRLQLTSDYRRIFSMEEVLKVQRVSVL